MKILIIRSSSMGDVVHALPAAWDIKQAMPDCEIHWLVEESFADILTLSPWIDRPVLCAFRRWRKSLLSSKTRQEISDFKKRLKDEKYDLVIDLQGLMRTALVARWCGVKSIGYSKDTIREPLASYLYTETRRVPEELRPVRRYRTMAAQCLGFEIDPVKPHYGLDVAPVIPLGVTGKYIAMCVNTSRDEKLWAEERWVAAAQALRNEGYTAVFFWGSQTEKERVERIAKEVEGSVVAPRSGLASLGAVIKGASALIGVDTGLAHLGAALAVPSVGIIVGTSADLFSLVSEGACETIGDKGLVPEVKEVLDAVHRVMNAKRA